MFQATLEDVDASNIQTSATLAYYTTAEIFAFVGLGLYLSSFLGRDLLQPHIDPEKKLPSVTGRGYFLLVGGLYMVFEAVDETAGDDKLTWNKSYSIWTSVFLLAYLFFDLLVLSAAIGGFILTTNAYALQSLDNYDTGTDDHFWMI